MRRRCFDAMLLSCTTWWLMTAVSPPVAANPIGLFGPEDNVERLNPQTYRRWHLKPTVKIVLFYADWCGHCRFYAPIFKALATDIKEWNLIVDVGVVNCADPANGDLCRENNITGFPTIKLFWIEQGGGGNTSSEIVARKPALVEAAIIDFIERKYEENGKPRGFPSFEPSRANSLEEIWNSVPWTVREIFVVVEPPGSYCGRELILDFNAKTTTGVVRFLRGNGSEEIRDKDSLSLIWLEKGVHPRVIASEADVTKARAVFKQKLIELGRFSIKPEISNNTTGGQPHATIGDYSKLYLDDFETGLAYTLKHEVALKQTLSPKQINILESFLQLISESIDLPARIRNYLQNVVQRLHGSAYLTGSDYTKLLESAKTPDAYLRTNTDFVGCKGSVPGKRGYTCSLWTIFHLATVGSHRRFLQHQEPNPNHAVLVIRDYVLNFFSCRECTEHFQSLVKNLESELMTPEDSALWLWRGHNNVNERLKGDITEDPERPKVQFPPESLCPECRDGGKFNESRVLKFLHRFYDLSNMIVSSESHYRGVAQSVTGSAANAKYFSGFDLTIFLVIYAVSITLLFVVFVAMVCRRRKVNFSRNSTYL